MFSKKIRRIRHSMGLPIEGFGTLIGVTGRTVQNWENGSTVPSALMYRDICKMYQDFKKRKKISGEIEKTAFAA